MFKTTLINLDADAAQAAKELGRLNLGELSPEELLVLLERFRGLDPIQNFEADPEIVLETRRRKRVVRLSHHKLYLFNPGNILESALGLTPAEIIAEMDGSAQVRTTRAFDSEALSPLLLLTRAVAQRPAFPLSPRARAVFALIALALAGYLTAAALGSDPSETAAQFAPLSDAREIEAVQASLVGVYMTGNRPGDHGIVIDTGGALKLFELNSESVPDLIRDTYRLGRINGVLSALGHQPGGAILATGKDTLTYCGETYRRLP